MFWSEVVLSGHLVTERFHASLSAICATCSIYDTYRWPFLASSTVTFPCCPVPCSTSGVIEAEKSQNVKRTWGGV